MCQEPKQNGEKGMGYLSMITQLWLLQNGKIRPKSAFPTKKFDCNSFRYLDDQGRDHIDLI